MRVKTLFFAFIWPDSTTKSDHEREIAFSGMCKLTMYVVVARVTDDSNGFQAKI
jgi:hypothetical protein